MGYEMAKNIEPGDVQTGLGFTRTAISVKVSEPDPDGGYQAVAILWEDDKGKRDNQYYDAETMVPNVEPPTTPPATPATDLIAQAKALLKTGNVFDTADEGQELALAVLKFFGEA